MKCMLCPRACGVDRSIAVGFCRLTETMLIGRIAPHLWEEPSISGKNGTGAVFFSGCTLRCVSCQNAEISHRNTGRYFSPSELADSLRFLTETGVHSVSLITATPFVPQILDTLKLYRPPLPIVWNTSGYETQETLKMLDGIVDIYLPDLKHFSSVYSGRFADAPDYFEKASAAITEMCRQTGPPVYDANGIMQRGTIVRHLILPGLTSESCRILTWIHDNLPSGTPVSLMSQYIPCEGSAASDLGRRITKREYSRVLEYMLNLGLTGFTQDRSSASGDYIPVFSRPESYIHASSCLQ